MVLVECTEAGQKHGGLQLLLEPGVGRRAHMPHGTREEGESVRVAERLALLAC